MIFGIYIYIYIERERERERSCIPIVYMSGDDGTSRLLLGNKVDCELDPARRAVDAVRGQQLAEEYGIPFLEVSAKSGQNIVEAPAVCNNLLIVLYDTYIYIYIYI